MLALRSSCRAMSHSLFLRQANSAHVQSTFKKVRSVQRVQRYLASTTSDVADDDLQKNEFFDKYKDKLKKRMQEMEERGETVELPSKAKPTSSEAQPSSASTSSTSDDTSDVRGGSMAASMQPPPARKETTPYAARAASLSNFQIRSLNSIVHLDAFRSKSAEEVEEIWKTHHLDKDCVTAVIPVEKYALLSSRAEQYRSFILPLPREDGFETMYVEFAGHQFQFTSLINYKTLGENAPALVTLSHYTELQASHGIVLMRGEFNTDFLNVLELQCLTNQLQMYYLAEEGSKYDEALKACNLTPESFDYTAVIELLKDSGMAYIQKEQQQAKQSRDGSDVGEGR